MAMPTSATGQGRGVVDAVPDHRHGAIRGLEAKPRHRPCRAGSTPARTRSAGIPTAAATERAARAPSPVTSHTSMPAAASSRTASAASGLISSTVGSAPATRPSRARVRRRRTRLIYSGHRAEIDARSGQERGRPDQRHPAVDAAAHAATGHGLEAVDRSPAHPASSARARIAAASGCSLPRSTDAATSRTSSVVKPGAATNRPQRRPGRASASPSCRTRPRRGPAASSRASPPRIRMPASAPLPVPTMIAVGVARPMAHGHEMTTTVMNATRAWVRLRVRPEYEPQAEGQGAHRRGRPARRCRRSDRPGAGSAPSTLSPPDQFDDMSQGGVATYARRPEQERAVAVHRGTDDLVPGRFSTGIGSPVSIDSSTSDSPSMRRPSTGTRSPGRTRTRSPTAHLRAERRSRRRPARFEPTEPAAPAVS